MRPIAALSPASRRRAVAVLAAAATLTVPGWPGPGSLAPADAAEVAPPPTTTAIDPVVTAGLTAADLPAGCVEPNRHLSLYAVELPRVDGQVRLGYGVTPDSASYPGPTIEMIEGECLAITVTNDVPESTLAELRDDPRVGMIDPDPANPLPLGISLHVHGVKYTQSSDGTMHTGSWVPPGQSRTYVWYAEPRTLAADGRVISHGTAGYWWYHDHVAGTDHGTGGLASGLFGALVVRRPGDPLPDRTFALAMGNDATLNLRTYPHSDTCDPDQPIPSDTCLLAYRDERIEFVIFGIGDDFHTFHLHGHTWVDNRNGVLEPTSNHDQLIDVIPLGPSASFGFQIIAGASVGNGDWMIHCHVQRHSDLGMFTFLHIVEPGEFPLPPAGTIDTLDHATTGTSLTHTGTRFRGAAQLPPAQSGQPDLGYYCSLPLSNWDRARNET
jgi:FtsP/CotA-like multicopper oxidase with cupredoxin domain